MRIKSFHTCARGALMAGALLAAASAARAAPIVMAPALAESQGLLQSPTRTATVQRLPRTIPDAVMPILVAEADASVFSSQAKLTGLPIGNGTGPLLRDNRPREVASNERASGSMGLPEPGFGSAFLATLALGVFFFIRRLN